MIRDTFHVFMVMLVLPHIFIFIFLIQTYSSSWCRIICCEEWIWFLLKKSSTILITIYIWKVYLLMGLILSWMKIIINWWSYWMSNCSKMWSFGFILLSRDSIFIFLFWFNWISSISYKRCSFAPFIIFQRRKDINNRSGFISR